MLLEIIIIVLRETLEASILIAVLLSVSRSQGVRFTWVPAALLAGLVGAFVYGSSLGEVSEWFDYAGQEVVNAGLQFTVYLLIGALISIQWLRLARSTRILRNLMSVIVFVVLIREGAELYIFYGGLLHKEGVLLKALTSGFVGVAVGLSVGTIVFYSLVMANQSKVKLFHSAVLLLVAAGMVLQATQLLIQVDWLSSGEPLWDSSWFIAEASVIGQMAYAIFGYEATPSLIELTAYSLSVVGIVAVAALVIKFEKTVTPFEEYIK
ncbi:FTR1 family protein [uncultured Paraglaciecola sp.]|uniref:FTR1 family protein n=1 Tax=uncultured Paraglaciecola sp. TaxID=1765024 RepID=UPI0026169A9B|nr:FTR1 family protein [uncultured Paraglaciecola sp.]